MIYIINIKDNIYKYGVTANIKKRLYGHKKKLDYNYPVKCWDAKNRSISKAIEDDIKLYMKHNKLSKIYNKETEVFESDNIYNILTTFNKYVEKHINEYQKQFVDEKMKQQSDMIKDKISRQS